MVDRRAWTEEVLFHLAAFIFFLFIKNKRQFNLASTTNERAVQNPGAYPTIFIHRTLRAREPN